MKPATAMILAAVLLFLGLFLLYPLGYVFREAFLPQGTFSLAFFRHALSDPVTREALLNSLLLAAVTTTATALLAVPLAVAIVRYRFPAKRILTGLLLVPMILPPFVGAVGMRQFLARFGSLNLLLLKAGLLSQPVDWLGSARFWGVVLLEVLHLYPIMLLNVVAALANVDPDLEAAAVNLGSSAWRRFRRVTLPLMMPGLFAGAIVVFIWTFTDLGTPLVFQYRRVVAVQIFNRVTDLNSNPEGYALVVLVVLVTMLAFLAGKWLTGRHRTESIGKGGGRARERDPGRCGRILLPAAFLGIVGLACLPHIAVVLTSIQDRWFMTILPEAITWEHYRTALGHDLTLPSIRNSITLSLGSTSIDLVLGVTVAYLLARTRFRGSALVDALVMLPLAVPGLVLAFGYVACFAGTPLDPRTNPMPLLIIAYAVRRLPYVVRAAYAGFRQINVALEEAAVNLGSTVMRALRRITVPLIGANLIAGAILAFAFAMLEVSDSLILALKEQHFPITKAIYQLLGRIEDGACVASALGVWAMLFLGLAMVAAGCLLGRRMGQLFRA